ncbi:MAG: enoyl-CoA hydratase/isomerase family protein [Gammaproteobacteria bacterium]|nr:enoyl-CoA hydratase/isomerase family protein [Gammaproteobacteria bacterium]
MSVTYERIDAVACLRLDRPAKLNAIDGAMIDAVHAALDRAEADAGVRAIVLAGNGRAFSAGFDLEAAADGSDPARLRADLQRDFELTMRFWDSPRPTVAAVHGFCLGGALEIACACDVTIAAADCRFGAPEVRFGSGIVTLILPWLIGVKQAKELLLVGDDRVSAERALALGLVNRVVPAADLEAEAMAVARAIAANDAHAVRLTKLAINRSCEIMGMRAALAQALELDVIIECTDTPESRAFNAVLARDGAKAAIAWRERATRGND